MSKHIVHSLEFTLQLGARANLKGAQWDGVLKKGAMFFFCYSMKDIQMLICV